MDLEDRYRHEREEAERRHECGIEHQLQNQSNMMQMFMMAMMEGRLKRKRDEEKGKADWDVYK